MPATPPRTDDGTASDRPVDVAVVGGGPAGCAAAIFTARYGLDTVVFDRGTASLRQCAYIENYLGFPAGIDIETFYALIHDHVQEAGCTLLGDMVEAVERAADDGHTAGDGSPDGRHFAVRTQEGRSIHARRVIAATRYDGDYLRPLDDGEMFETHEYDGEVQERFDREYADRDGTTPVDGLFVASPSHAADRQAIVAAGRGARVGLRVVAAVRRERGYPGDVATHYDWVRRAADRDQEWDDRERWREQFDDLLPEDHDFSEDRRRELREREIDRRLATYRTETDIEAATREGQRRLLERVDDELIRERARTIDTDLTDTQGGA